MDKVANEHRARYKNSGLNSKELRRRREEGSVQLRRQKRDDVLSKRRTLNSIEDEHDMNTSDIMNNSSVVGAIFSNNAMTGNDQQATAAYASNDTITNEMVAALCQNENEELLIETAQKVRKILSKEPQPPFDGVIQRGLLPRFVELLQRHDNNTIQFEVAWILTNICSGTSEQTQTVVSNGAVPQLVELLSSPSLRVREQSVWALGNIIGDCAQLRDLVIGYDFVPRLLQQIVPDIDVSFLRNIAWVLVNLCRNKEPPPSMDIVRQLLPYLQQLIHSPDLNILTDSTWAVSYITELGADYCQLIINDGMLPHMTPLLTHDDVKIQTAAIRALGSIVTGDEKQTQAVIDAGALPHLHKLIRETHNDKIVKEALWFISNIAAGSVDQIQHIIDNKLVHPIIQHMEEGDFSAKKESAWTIYNMSLSGTPDQLEHLCKLGVVPALCGLFKVKDQTIIRNTLETLTSLLNQCSDRISDLPEQIEECGGLDEIEELQTNPNPDIYEFAFRIIERYFGEGDENGEEQ